MVHNNFVVVVSTIKFSQVTYSSVEDNGPLQPELILSNPLSTNVTVQVGDKDDTAIGECNITVYGINRA